MQPNAEQIEFWNAEVGRRWASRAAMTERVFAPVTHRLLSLAAARPGERVVDVGCGCGSTTVVLGQAVAPNGRVLGLDVSRPMLDIARERAAAAGSGNVDYASADAATERFETGTFDLVFSQFGVMFFDDLVAAFANLRAAASGGRLAFAAWRPVSDNAWQSIPLRAAEPFLPPAPPADPLAPGPFALSDPERIRRILNDAGFHDLRIEPFDADLPLGADAEEAALTLSHFGAVSRRLLGAPEATTKSTVAAIADALRPRLTGAGVALQAGTWMVSARA